MRTSINLATQPYQSVSRFMMQWTAILGSLVILAGFLGYLAYSRWHNYRVMSANIAREQQTLADYEGKQTQDLAILNKAENHDVRERSDYINGLILRKEVSWTKIFVDLEKMMPPHLRVLSLSPQIDQDKLLINMALGGDSRDRAAELVRRMESSKTFRSAQIISENEGESGGDTSRFIVTAEYVPGNEPHAVAPSPTTTSQVTGGGKH